MDHEAALLQSTAKKIASADLADAPIAGSLALVSPDHLLWRVESDGDRIRKKASFVIDGIGWFNLPVTDPLMEERLDELELTSTPYPRDAVGIDVRTTVLLTVSLSEPFEKTDDCYKLVAGVLELPA